MFTLPFGRRRGLPRPYNCRRPSSHFPNTPYPQTTKKHEPCGSCFFVRENEEKKENVYMK